MLGTSVVSQIAAQDLTFAANFIQSRNFRAFETYLVVTAAYFVLALALRQLLAWIGQRFVVGRRTPRAARPDRKSTRLNSSHSQISYAVFCLKKKKKKI